MKKFIADLIWKFYATKILTELKKELCSFLKAMFDIRNVKDFPTQWNTMDYYWQRSFTEQQLQSISNIIIEAVDERYKRDLQREAIETMNKVLKASHITSEQFIDNVVERINKKKVL